MISIEQLRPEHLPQSTTLVDAHIGAVVPGWAVPEPWLATHLERNPGEFVVDPWVIARTTLVALERQSVVAVAHMLRYGSGPEVSTPYRGGVEVDWLVAVPSARDASERLLGAVAEQAAAWGAGAVWFGGGPPVGPIAGIPDTWPHVTAAIEAAGYRRDPGRVEVLYGGELASVPSPGNAPLPGLSIRRSVGRWGSRFDAMEGERSVGYSDIVTDLSAGGALPALRGWAELAEVEVESEWRNRGIGSWLLCHAAAWARLGGCEGVLLITTAEDEAAGTGRLYRRLGCAPLTRITIGWSLARS